MIARSTNYHAYKAAAHTVSKTRQIVMLYDGTIRFLQQAHEAMQEKRIEDRYHLLVKASNVLIGLQSSLDFDAHHDMATTLYDFYSDIDARIMQLHRTNDVTECLAVIEELRQMRNVWDVIDKAESPEAASETAAAQPVAADAAEAAPQAEPEALAPLNGVIVSA